VTNHDDRSIEEVLDLANQITKTGAKVYQKFTCSTCGSRQTIDQPNTFFAEATCEECGGVTQIKACGMMVVQTF